MQKVKNKNRHMVPKIAKNSKNNYIVLHRWLLFYTKFHNINVHNQFQLSSVPFRSENLYSPELHPVAVIKENRKKLK